MKRHHYRINVTWTGAGDKGTASYSSYKRDHIIQGKDKPALPGSSEPAFRGDPSRYNPEELLVATLSACHMLWYLHLAAINDIVVLEYEDAAGGIMEEQPDGSGAFVQATLRPMVKIAPGGDVEKARLLHDEAHHLCFIANSVNFPVDNEPEIIVAE